jgi:hypothetical protein
LDIAAFTFKFHFRDTIKRHAHLLEPGYDRFFIGSFHHADGFAFGKVDKAAITLDAGVLLRRLRKLAELVSREFPRWQCVCT